MVFECLNSETERCERQESESPAKGLDLLPLTISQRLLYFSVVFRTNEAQNRTGEKSQFSNYRPLRRTTKLFL